MGVVYVSGELSTDTYVDIPTVARNTLIDIGYTKSEYGFDGYTAGVITSINDQSPELASPELALGIPTEGAGDTSIVVGYATNETDNYMPLPCNIANGITERIDYLRKEDIIPFFRPDGKAIAEGKLLQMHMEQRLLLVEVLSQGKTQQKSTDQLHIWQDI